MAHHIELTSTTDAYFKLAARPGLDADRGSLMETKYGADRDNILIPPGRALFAVRRRTGEFVVSEYHSRVALVRAMLLLCPPLFLFARQFT